HPYIEILKKKFQPRSEKNETIDSYLTLIYGELEDLPNQPNIEKLSDTDDSSSVSEDENISSAGKRRHWQFAHRQFKRNMYKKHSKGRSQNRKKIQSHNKGKGKSNVSQRSQNKSVESNDIYEIEYLPPTDTSGLLDNVRAAIYLSLDELWCVPNDIALVASILDPRMKSLRFTTDTQRTNTRIKLRDDDFFAEVFNLGGSNNDIIEFEEDE
ncbi:18667_t:CDS:2, partial [Racocetra persica]